jgi:hypothetical protein
MVSETDLETKRSLWKAALKYQQRVREETRREREGLEILASRAAHAQAQAGAVGDGRRMKV